MREIVVISGKGGTGKTSLCAAFAALARGIVLCDLDVDVPDLHIIAAPRVRESHSFLGGNKAFIRQSDCQSCGRCRELCHFDAVREENGNYNIDALSCEGCGVCAKLCPVSAIDFLEAHCGDWFVSDTRFGPFVHAQLVPGQENSGKLVSLLKQKARELARREGLDTLLCDGSPGIGCPVISSLSGASLAVAVVEPTLSGRNDFERVAGVCRHFHVPVGVVINKADLSDAETERIEASCCANGCTIFGRVPFDPVITEAATRGMAVSEGSTSLSSVLRDIWSRIDAFRGQGTNARSSVSLHQSGIIL